MSLSDHPSTFPPSIGQILSKALDERPLSDRELVALMRIREASALDRLFTTARRLRKRYFGRRVFLYGFVYAGTHCRNRCRFCLYRHGNPHAPRYRKTTEGIIEAARSLAASGVHLIDLTMGEDPVFYRDGYDGHVTLLDTVEQLATAVDRPVMVSPGVVPEAVLRCFVEMGVRWYACYQETHNRKLFQYLRKGQDYDQRWRIKQTAKEMGLFIEEGLLCGVGESTADVVHSLRAMGRQNADQIRVMTFVPQPGTPMDGLPEGDPVRELKIMALMRLCYPQLLIPASMDVAGHDGLRQRLDAGANVVTSLVPPGQGLAGVARSRMDIEDGRRTVEGIGDVLDACGLAPAPMHRFHEWMHERSGKDVRRLSSPDRSDKK